MLRSCALFIHSMFMCQLQKSSFEITNDQSSFGVKCDIAVRRFYYLNKSQLRITKLTEVFRKIIQTVSILLLHWLDIYCVSFKISLLLPNALILWNYQVNKSGRNRFILKNQPFHRLHDLSKNNHFSYFHFGNIYFE